MGAGAVGIQPIRPPRVPIADVRDALHIAALQRKRCQQDARANTPSAGGGAPGGRTPDIGRWRASATACSIARPACRPAKRRRRDHSLSTQRHGAPPSRPAGQGHPARVPAPSRQAASRKEQRKLVDHDAEEKLTVPDGHGCRSGLSANRVPGRQPRPARDTRPAPSRLHGRVVKIATISACSYPVPARKPSDPERRRRRATHPLVRGSPRPDTVLRFRPAHLRVTVVVAAATVARPRQQTPP
jgi:hypothetical protein